jgi:hypothetical protein
MSLPEVRRGVHVSLLLTLATTCQAGGSHHNGHAVSTRPQHASRRGALQTTTGRQARSRGSSGEGHR